MHRFYKSYEVKMYSIRNFWKGDKKFVIHIYIIYIYIVFLHIIYIFINLFTTKPLIMNTQRKKVKKLIVITAIIGLLTFNMLNNLKSENIKINFNYAIASADEEGDPWKDCTVGEVQTTGEEKVRWCGDCDSHYVKRTGDGGCK